MTPPMLFVFQRFFIAHHLRTCYSVEVSKTWTEYMKQTSESWVPKLLKLLVVLRLREVRAGHKGTGTRQLHLFRSRVLEPGCEGST